MKKIEKIKILILITLFMFGMLSSLGCGSGATVNTILTINSDFSGVRTMQMVFAKSTFNDYFKGSIDDLNNTLNSSKPEAITYDYSEVDGKYYYQFYIQFSSIEDYDAKVDAIIGEDRNVVISCPDSVWVSGIYVEEDYTSTDLLKWLSDALVANGQLSSSYVSNLFGSGTTKVVFLGEEIASSTQIYVDEIEYLRINSVDIYTDINDLETVNRQIQFNIPAESMNNKGNEIDDAMNAVKPAIASLNKEEIDGNTLYTFSGENLTASDVDSFMKSVFGQDNASTITENVDDYYSPFSFNHYINDNFNLQNYVQGNVSTNVRYYVKSNLPEIEFTAVDPFEGYYDQYDDYNYNADDSEYILVLDSTYYGSDAYAIDVPLLMQKNYKVKTVDAELSKGLFSTWTREIKFTLETIPTEEEIEIIKTKIELKYLPDGSSETESIVEVSESTEENGTSETEKEKVVTSLSTNSGDEFTLTINQKGTLDQIQREASELFGQSLSTYYMCENGLLKIKKLASIEDRLCLGNYVDNTTQDYSFNYSVELGMLSRIEECNLYEEDYTFENGKLKIAEDGNTVYLDVVYSTVDLWVVGSILLVILFIILLVVSIKASGIIKIVKKVPDAQENVITTDEVRYCAKCGEINSIENKVCTKCGEKMEG